MADRGEAAGALGPYPSPPWYLWTEFTEANVKQQRENQQRARHAVVGSLDTAPSIEVISYLQPPLPPPSGQWRMFGQVYSLGDELPSIEDQGFSRLGPPDSRESAEKNVHSRKVLELKKLSKSLLLNFLELAGILSICPEDAAEKLADVQTILYNMHQHINEWRPHQAREALISLLQSQLERTRNETRVLHEVSEGVRNTLMNLSGPENPDATDSTSLVDDLSEGSIASLNDPERSRNQETWAVLQELFG